MAPSGATLMPGSVTLAPGIATGARNGPEAPAVVVPASPASGDAASVTTAARAALRLHRDLTKGGTAEAPGSCAPMLNSSVVLTRTAGSANRPRRSRQPA